MGGFGFALEVLLLVELLAGWVVAGRRSKWRLHGMFAAGMALVIDGQFHLHSQTSPAWGLILIGAVMVGYAVASQKMQRDPTMTWKKALSIEEFEQDILEFVAAIFFAALAFVCVVIIFSVPLGWDTIILMDTYCVLAFGLTHFSLTNAVRAIRSNRKIRNASRL